MVSVFIDLLFGYFFQFVFLLFSVVVVSSLYLFVSLSQTGPITTDNVYNKPCNLVFFKLLFFIISVLVIVFFLTVGFFLFCAPSSHVVYMHFWGGSWDQLQGIWSFFVDNVSLLFLILLTFLIPICIIINIFCQKQSQLLIRHSLRSFLNAFELKGKHTYSVVNKCDSVVIVSVEMILGLLLMISLEVFLFILFTTSDLFLFYICFEVSMLPLYFMIGLFGSRINKIKASYYLFFFTVAGSVFFLTAILLLWCCCGSVDFFVLLNSQLSDKISNIVWLLLFLPLSVKVPVFPLHVWLPEAHVEASTEGSVLLAGLLLKIGLYGMIRFLIPIFPAQTGFFLPLVHVIALMSIILASFAVFVQIDIKKIIAYSSIVHMNFAMLGLFSGTINGVKGGLYLMFTHGITSSGMFIIVGFLYFRYHTRVLAYYQGLVVTFPLFSSVFLLLCLSNSGIPGTGGFVGEILVIFGLLEHNILIAFVSLVAPFFGAILSLLLFVRMFFGVPTLSDSAYDENLSNSLLGFSFKLFVSVFYLEYTILIVLSVLVVHTGVFAQLYLDQITVSTLLLFV